MHASIYIAFKRYCDQLFRMNVEPCQANIEIVSVDIKIVCPVSMTDLIHQHIEQNVTAMVNHIGE